MCVQYVVVGPNMLYGISGSLLPLECGMSNHPNVHLFTLDTEELYLFSLKGTNTHFRTQQQSQLLHSLSSVLCTRTRDALSCIDSQSFDFYIPHERRRPGGLTSLWIGTRFALEWTYIGSIFTIHYKVDSLLN